MELEDISLTIHNAVDPEKNKMKPDLFVFLDIGDKMNSSNSHAVTAVKSIISLLNSKEKYKRWYTILLIECLVKNCNMRFHYELLSKPFCKTILKILQKRRGVKQMFNNLVSKDSHVQRQIEDKVLYLIQLWYDTFMMDEGEFKEIIGCYKTLRKEGVIFPQRDPNEAFMIKFTGTTSPIFQTVEANRIYEDPIKQLKPNQNFKVNNDYFSDPAHQGIFINC